MPALKDSTQTGIKAKTRGEFKKKGGGKKKMQIVEKKGVQECEETKKVR